MAQKYRPTGQQNQQPHAPGVYADLKHALYNGDEDAARVEIVRLITEGGKTGEKVAAAAGWEGGKINGKIKPEYYTGTKEGDIAMEPHLTEEQKSLYLQARKENKAAALLFRKVVAGLPEGQKEALKLASAANRKGNRGLAKTLGGNTP